MDTIFKLCIYTFFELRNTHIYNTLGPLCFFLLSFEFVVRFRFLPKSLYALGSQLIRG